MVIVDGGGVGGVVVCCWLTMELLSISCHFTCRYQLRLCLQGTLRSNHIWCTVAYTVARRCYLHAAAVLNSILLSLMSYQLTCQNKYEFNLCLLLLDGRCYDWLGLCSHGVLHSHICCTVPLLLCVQAAAVARAAAVLKSIRVQKAANAN